MLSELLRTSLASFTPEEWACVMGGAHIVTGRACARVRFSIW